MFDNEIEKTHPNIQINLKRKNKQAIPTLRRPACTQNVKIS